MEQSYEIMPCGTKAKTLNPLGKKPMYEVMPVGTSYENREYNKRRHTRELEAWQQAEDSRVTYEIAFIGNEPYPVKAPAAGTGHIGEYYLTPGQIVRGTIHNNKLRII